MLKKILKTLLNSNHRHYSSSDYRRHGYKNHGYHGHSSYGHNHYKRKHGSGSFFSSFFSS